MRIQRLIASFATALVFCSMVGCGNSSDKKITGERDMRDAKVGDYILFGTYEQDNNTSNGKEDIEWLVLEIKDEKALVISKYALDCQPYNRRFREVTWETCTLRKWLNNDFINAAFSAEEKAMIPTVTVSADKNPDYNTDPGEATQDQVFLLSITEMNKYFNSDSARQCEPTDYAAAKGDWGDLDFLLYGCWLRSPGPSQVDAAYVEKDGAERGNWVSCSDYVVRPALWIDMSDSSEPMKYNEESKIVDSYFYEICEKLRDVKVGDYILFGAYEQDNNLYNGVEDIEWLVLEIKDGKALVISKYALSREKYNWVYEEVTWETCSLRKWLNNDFINAAFLDEEKAMIPTVTVSADKNPEYSTNPGKATQDQVFLLSITETNKYFNSDSARLCEPTDSIAMDNSYDVGGHCDWWLRSPGEDQRDAAQVYDRGFISGRTPVDDRLIAVRPALWIDLNSVIF